VLPSALLSEPQPAVGPLLWLLQWPIRASLLLLFGLPWAIASLGGLLVPVSWLFDGLIAVILLGWQPG